MNKRRLVLFCTTLSAIIAVNSAGQSLNWEAPETADDLINPFVEKLPSIQLGQNLYTENCFLCHGLDGKGETEYSKELLRPSGDLTNTKNQTQSDGALFWKISEGRAPMLAYKYALSKEQRWALVNYLRKLGNAKNINKEVIPIKSSKDTVLLAENKTESINTILDTIKIENAKDSIQQTSPSKDISLKKSRNKDKNKGFEFPKLSFAETFLFIGFAFGFGVILMLILVLNKINSIKR